MAAAQKRLLSAPNSKLAKSDLVSVLRRDDAWIMLPAETRRQLYSLLPGLTADGDTSDTPDVDIHPLNTGYKTYIEEEIRRFKEDLKEGRHQKKWRDEALQAGRDRLDGKFDDWKAQQREEYWGVSAETENVKPNGAAAKEAAEEVNGGGSAEEDVNGEDGKHEE